jgi:Ca-activated chloride channel family protein
MLVPEQDGFLWRLPLAAPAHTTAEADGGAPDAAEPADAAPTPTPIAIEIELEPGFPLAWLRSPTHELRRTSLDGEAVRLSTRARGDRDLELAWRWRPASEPAVKILAEPTDRGDTAVLLMWLPPEDTSAGPWRTPRDWVLALDTSGSMAGAPIRQARAAIAAAIDRLDPADRFDLVAFDEEATRLFGEARPANRDNKEAARHFVQGLDAGGGTNIAAALDAALPGPSGGDPDDRVRQVVFVSDGAAPDEARLLERLDAQLGRARFHAVAIGSAPNGAFLRAAARIGRGSVTFIPARREVGERMARLFEKLESPVTTDLEVHWNDPVEMWPPRLPDLLAGEPLVATALIPRFVGEVAVTGRRRGRPVDWRVPLVAGAERAGIARLFARHKIRALTDSLARGADREAVDRAVLETALRHGIVSRQTSLVAVDVSPLRPPSAPSVRRDGSARLGAASDPFAEGMGVLPAGATSGPLWLRLGITLLGLSTIVGLARPLGRARR